MNKKRARIILIEYFSPGLTLETDVSFFILILRRCTLGVSSGRRQAQAFRPGS
jgi:hypothetical protein